MKNQFIYAAVLLLTIACNNNPKPLDRDDELVGNDTSTWTPIDYPYSLETPYKDWKAGNPENVVLVQKMIKAWETKNVAECAAYFGDTASINMDYLSERLPNNGIASFLNSSYEMYASNLKVVMQDWESVVSKNGDEEWVTLWYKQSWTDAKGVADSVNLINDAKIENGKIVQFDEYVQHFPTGKK